MSFSSRASAAIGFALSGVAFAAYPILRPYGPEAGAEFAADLASPLWLVAHVCGMVGFAALAFALRALATAGAGRLEEVRPWRRVETRMWLALALLLPYYGAEAYGLSAVGRHARDGHLDVLAVAESFRYAPFEVNTFGVGLLVLALVGGHLVRATWGAADRVTRLGGALAGLGLLTFLPQFFTAPEVRMAHGVVLGLGLVVLARAVAGRSELKATDADHSAAARPSADVVTTAARG